MENLQQELAHQATLERLGWKFQRVRGTLFFLDPDAALAPVYAALAQLGIVPEPERKQAPLVPSTALRDRVMQRAAEIRYAWAQESELRSCP
jgi:hypothetical protein